MKDKKEEKELKDKLEEKENKIRALEKEKHRSLGFHRQRFNRREKFVSTTSSIKLQAI